MRYPFVKQTDLKDCGVCSLLMIIRYYGGGVSKEYLRDITNTTKAGVTAYSLIEASKKLGFSSYAVKGDISNLKQDNLPCIAHLVINKSYEHFIVIYKINHKKKYLLIADPNKKGITKISFDEFLIISSNNYLLLTPNKKINYVAKNQKLKNFIFNFISSNLLKFLFIFIISFFITLINIIYSFNFKILIQYVIEYQNIQNLVLLSFTFTIILIIKEISNFYRNYVLNNISHDLDKSLFTNVYRHLLSLPYLYYKNRTTGEIVSRMNDLVSIRNVISKFIISIIIDLSLAFLTFITLFFISDVLGLIVLILIILNWLTLLIFNKPLDNKLRKCKQEYSQVDSYLVETISGIETIKNQNIKNYIVHNFNLKYEKYNSNSYLYNKIFIFEDSFKNFINSLFSLIILIIGSYLVINNKLDIASLITFLTLLSYIISPIENIIDLIISLKDAKISYERIRELYEVEEVNDNRRKRLNSFNGNILSNHLLYSYNQKDLFLKDINIKINQGDKVLIYGESGSGKSTLAKILAKELDIKNKCLYYDDKDINLYSNNQIKDDICYISQNETLFTDSIYNNMVLDKSIEYDDFLKIADLCELSGFVMNNPLAYDFLLEENGFNISGGQRQRIILARSLIKNSKVYILDEALNQVDINTERKILTNVFNKYPDKTFIIISHRFHNQDLFTKKYQIKDGVSYEECL